MDRSISVKRTLLFFLYLTKIAGFVGGFTYTYENRDLRERVSVNLMVIQF